MNTACNTTEIQYFQNSEKLDRIFENKNNMPRQQQQQQQNINKVISNI